MSVYILLHLADFDSSMLLNKYYLVSTTFLSSSLMTTGPVRPNHGTPPGRETFITHSSFIPTVTFVLDISLIEVGEF